MSESYSVEAILSVQDKGFTSAFKNAESMLKGLGGTTSGASKGISGLGKSFLGANLAASAITGTVRAVSNGIGSMVGELNDSSKAWQTFEGNMGMLGKSKGEIKSAKTAMQDFATQTIYSASDMATTYAQMAAIGTDNVETLVKGMGGLAAASENPAQAMKTLSTQMVQALTKPKMTWADFKLMLEQSPAGMSAVAKEMGMSLDDLVLSIQDGEVSSKDFANAVAKVGTNADFSKMATEFKTVDQAIDGLREGISNKLQPAFDKVSKVGIKAISSISDAIDGIDIEMLSKGFKEVTRLLRVGTKGIQEFFRPISKGFSNIGKELGNFGSGLKEAWRLLGDGNWKKAITRITSSASQLFKGIGREVGNMASGIMKNIKAINWGKVGSDLFKGIGKLQNMAMDALGDLSGWIADGIDALNWSDVGKGLVDILENTIGKGINNLDNKKMFSGLNRLKDSLFKAVGDLANGLGDGLFSDMKNEFKAIDMFFDELDKIQWKGDFGQLFADIQSAWDKAMASINFEFNWNDLLPSMSAGTWGDWKMDWNHPIQSIIQGMKDGWNKLKSTVSGWWKGVKWPTFKWPNFKWPKLTWKAPNLGNNPLSKIVDKVRNWFSEFKWPSFRWPSFSWPSMSWKSPSIGDNPLTKVIEKTKKWFSSFKWPSFKWPEFKWPEFKLPKIDINFDSVLADIKNAWNDFKAGVDEFVNSIDLSFMDPSTWFGGGKKFSMKDIGKKRPKGGTLDGTSGAFSVGELKINADSVNFDSLTQKIDQGIKSAMEKAKSNVALYGEGIANTLKATFARMGGAIQTGNLTQSMTSGIRSAMEAVKSLVAQAGDGIANTFKASFSKLGAQTQTGMTGVTTAVSNGMTRTNSAVINNLVRMATTFQTNFNRIVQVTQTSMTQVVQQITNGMTKANSTVVNNMVRMASTFQSNFNRIVQITQTSMNQFNTIVQSAMSRANSTVTNAMTQMTNTIQNAMNRIVQITQSSMNQFNSIIQNSMTQANSTVTNGMNQMVTTIQNGMNRIIQITQSSMNQFVNIISQNMTQANSAVTNGMSQMVSAFTNGGNQMVSVASNTTSQVVAQFNTLSSSLYNAGINGGQGAANGLRAMRGAVANAAAALANAANSAYRNTLDIHSPSRVMFANGIHTGEGAVNGILAMVKPMKQASESLAKSAIPDIGMVSSKLSKFRNTVANVAGFNTGSVKASQTISADTNNAELSKKLDKLIEAVEAGAVIVMDKERVGQKLRGPINRNLGQDISLEGRHTWA